VEGSLYHIAVLSGLPSELVEIRGWLKTDPEVILQVEGILPDGSLRAVLDGVNDLLVFGVPSSGWIDLTCLQPGILIQHPFLIVIATDLEFIRRAFACQALDYLIRPLVRDSFLESIAWGKSQVERRRRAQASDPIFTDDDAAGRADEPFERIMVRAGSHILLVRVADIDWIEAYGNYVRLHAGGKSHILRHTMAFFEQRLSPELFARIHRSVIVNLERIKEMEQSGDGDYALILGDGTRLNLGRSYRETLMSRFAE
jgi:two-component system LytT family response regulator